MNRSVDFLIAIAKSYYIDELTQSEIAVHYKISRPTVASILKECKKKGIVEIRIKDNVAQHSPLAQQLVKIYNLQTASIIANEETDASTLIKTCRSAAMFLTSFLKDGLRIGLGWGTSLYQMIQVFERSVIHGGEVIQLMGGFGGSPNLPDGSELARVFASKLHARCFTLLAPLFVKSEWFKKSLLLEKGIRETYEKTKNLDIALVGISSDDPKESRLVQAGFISQREASEIYNTGSCCDVCGYHYDKQGRLMNIPANRRLVGIDPQTYLSIPRRIGIACGEPKANAIRAALQGKLVTDIFTDEATAALLLKH
ncbi:MAG: winged helix-turn-helix transcriptional regulator [Treponema sp.]|nr:winged helix-turn-helix transcriptional regulator [Treponema sp.]